MAEPSGPRAGFWRRFAAVLVDGILLGVVASILTALLSEDRDLRDTQNLSTLLGIFYYTYFEGSTGQTLGKRLLNIRVVDARVPHAAPIGYVRAFIRYLMSFVSGIALLVGYLWMLWDRERQTWHDKVAGAYVVPADADHTGAVADPWEAERTAAGDDDAPGPDVSGTTFR